MLATSTSSSLSPTPVRESRRNISETSSIHTGRRSAPNGWAPAWAFRSPGESSRRTADGSGWRASPGRERSSTSRFRSRRNASASARHARRNRQHIADAQLGEEPDQPPSFFVGCFEDAAETLNLIVVRRARDRESGLRLLGEEDGALAPSAVLESIAEKAGVGAAHGAVTVDRTFRQRRGAGRRASLVELLC